jgi:phosphoserine phosphatase RsbX
MAPMAGEVALADRHLVLPRRDDVLVAVLDGIGHGESAEFAASEATQTLRDAPLGSLESLVARCHDRLRTTRGVVMSLASLDQERGILTWLGVGNVAGVVFRNPASSDQRHQTKSLLLRGGVVGLRLPTLLSDQVQLEDGDTVVFATDGVASDFDQEHGFNDAPQKLAERLLKRYGKGTDDALVLVIRYQRGGQK